MEIANSFSQLRSNLVESVNSLDAKEIERLNEALHCFLKGCYFSTIAMAVTAIEFTLLFGFGGLSNLLDRRLRQQPSAGSPYYRERR